MRARMELANMAEGCVFPNEERVKIFKKQTGTNRPVECVWNVPSDHRLPIERKAEA